jgi:hypothetical protein
MSILSLFPPARPSRGCRIRRRGLEAVVGDLPRSARLARGGALQGRRSSPQAAWLARGGSLPAASGGEHTERNRGERTREGKIEQIESFFSIASGMVGNFVA